MNVPKHKIKIPPSGGWKESTWYLVEVSFNSHNPIHLSMFYSGFLQRGEPGGYNGFQAINYGIDDESMQYHNAYFLNPVLELFSCDTIEDSYDTRAPIPRYCGTPVGLQ